MKAQEYQRNKTSNATLPRDLGMEALGKLLRKEIPARIQANNATDIRTALRLAQEFNFDIIIDGAAGAWEFKDELAAKKVALVLGQVSNEYVSNEEIPDKQDYPKPDERLAGRLTNAGIPTAMATFSRAFGTLAPAGTGKWLLIDAALAAGYGMTDDQVLRAVTLVPAQILGVADRVGSLEVGKDADVVVLDGPPLSVKTWVQRVYVNGSRLHEVDTRRVGVVRRRQLTRTTNAGDAASAGRFELATTEWESLQVMRRVSRLPHACASSPRASLPAPDSAPAAHVEETHRKIVEAEITHDDHIHGGRWCGRADRRACLDKSEQLHSALEVVVRIDLFLREEGRACRWGVGHGMIDRERRPHAPNAVLGPVHEVACANRLRNRVCR